MSNLIPNQNSFIGFVAGTVSVPFGIANLNAPTAAEIAAALDLTDFLVSLNASSTGNTVPTPRLRSLFETSVPGTASAQFTGDFYRDDEDDAAWDALPRGMRGTWIVKRFGGTGVGLRPVVGQECELWPVIVASRAGGALSSGTAQTFTVTGSVPKEPVENAIVVA